MIYVEFFFLCMVLVVVISFDVVVFYFCCVLCCVKERKKNKCYVDVDLGMVGVKKYVVKEVYLIEIVIVLCRL